MTRSRRTWWRRLFQSLFGGGNSGRVVAAPSRDRFAECIDLILSHEGGYVDHPDDPGGATNLGITHKTLSAWRGENVTKQDVRGLRVEEAREIYRANYWNAAGCDKLPVGVDLVVFDMAVNAGVGRALKLLQGIVGVEQDGGMGPITLGAVTQRAPVPMIERYTEARMRFYRSLRHWPTFKNGWTRRTDETRARALKDARG